MKVTAFVKETAQLNAFSEEGKTSGDYRNEAINCYFHGDDMESWNLTEGKPINCKNLATGASTVLVARKSRYVSQDHAVIMRSPWIRKFVVPDEDVIQMEFEESSTEPPVYNELLNELKGVLP
ncbi:MAG: hypothetical protein ACTSUE_01520 [Promethearchaeota archaeon]